MSLQLFCQTFFFNFFSMNIRFYKLSYHPKKGRKKCKLLWQKMKLAIFHCFIFVSIGDLIKMMHNVKKVTNCSLLTRFDATSQCHKSRWSYCNYKLFLWTRLMSVWLSCSKQSYSLWLISFQVHLFPDYKINSIPLAIGIGRDVHRSWVIYNINLPQAEVQQRKKKPKKNRDPET